MELSSRLTAHNLISERSIDERDDKSVQIDESVEEGLQLKADETNEQLITLSSNCGDIMKAQLTKMMRKVQNEMILKRKAPEAASKAILNCLDKKKTQIQTVMGDIERIIDNKAELLFADITQDKVKITPDFQCRLDSAGRFVKYIGSNILFV